jgi:hypothetical protein
VGKAVVVSLLVIFCLILILLTEFISVTLLCVVRCASSGLNLNRFESMTTASFNYSIITIMSLIY